MSGPQATEGKTVTCKAAVAWEPNQPLDVTDVEVAPPQAGEVRVKIISTAPSQTDVSSLLDQATVFPCVPGIEATAVVESVGEGVSSVRPGDVVIPCYTPECRKHDCIFCKDERTNLCPAISSTQDKGVMPNGTSRLSKDGKEIFHFMGCSTFAEYAVIAEISAAKINPGADLDQMCLLGDEVATGWGAVFNTMKVQSGTSVAVFGLGALGLSVIQAAKVAGARYIVGIDNNDAKFGLAKELGAKDCVNSLTCEGGDVKTWLLSKEKWGYDYTFDCSRVMEITRTAMEIAHRGWGQSCIIHGASTNEKISSKAFPLVAGRTWAGSVFGGWKSRTELPKLVQTVMRGELPLESFITDKFSGLAEINNALAALQTDTCVRAVLHIADTGFPPARSAKLKKNVRLETGWLKQLSHWSDCCQCQMTFSFFMPDQARTAPPPPVLYFLTGLTGNDEMATQRIQFAGEAARYRLPMAFPDTSPRGVNIPGEDDQWDFGSSASFYVDATVAPWAKHYQMYTYITKEFPKVINSLFPVDPDRLSITGHSMGGGGAMMAHFKNPGMFTSVSAFAPISNPLEVGWGTKVGKTGGLAS